LGGGDEVICTRLGPNVHTIDVKKEEFEGMGKKKETKSSTFRDKPRDCIYSETPGYPTRVLWVYPRLAIANLPQPGKHTKSGKPTLLEWNMLHKLGLV
jgi:hypothetical protein